MEIISYVGFNNAQPSFKKKTRTFPLHLFIKQKNSKYNFSAARAFRGKRTVSIPNFYNSVTVFIKSFSRFLKKHLLILLCAVLCSFAVTASLLIFSYVENHTGPVAMKFSDGASELDILDDIMARFALDENIVFNDKGVILDSDGNEIIPVANFKTAVTFQDYVVKSGDTISGITKRYGLTNLSTLIGINDIASASGLRVGQRLRVPSIDGLMYTVKDGDTILELAAKNNITVEDLLDVNDFSSQTLLVGQEIFIPGARLSNDKLSQALGTYFANPLTASYRITSRFGNRADPFTGQNAYHTGIDLACPTGTPIKATQKGSVAFVGYSNVFGNYIIINHGNGYQSLYAHLSKTMVARGQNVSQGTQIGLVGSTGYSTGSHLHFTVYKNGKLVNPSTLVKF